MTEESKLRYWRIVSTGGGVALVVMMLCFLWLVRYSDHQRFEALVSELRSSTSTSITASEREDILQRAELVGQRAAIVELERWRATNGLGERNRNERAN